MVSIVNCCADCVSDTLTIASNCASNSALPTSVNSTDKSAGSAAVAEAVASAGCNTIGTTELRGLGGIMRDQVYDDDALERVGAIIARTNQEIQKIVPDLCISMTRTPYYTQNKNGNLSDEKIDPRLGGVPAEYFDNIESIDNAMITPIFDVNGIADISWVPHGSVQRGFIIACPHQFALFNVLYHEIVFTNEVIANLTHKQRVGTIQTALLEDIANDYSELIPLAADGKDEFTITSKVVGVKQKHENHGVQECNGSSTLYIADSKEVTTIVTSGCNKAAARDFSKIAGEMYKRDMPMAKIATILALIFASQLPVASANPLVLIAPIVHYWYYLMLGATVFGGWFGYRKISPHYQALKDAFFIVKTMISLAWHNRNGGQILVNMQEHAVQFIQPIVDNVKEVATWSLTHWLTIVQSAVILFMAKQLHTMIKLIYKAKQNVLHANYHVLDVPWMAMGLIFTFIGGDGKLMFSLLTQLTNVIGYFVVKPIDDVANIISRSAEQVADERLRLGLVQNRFRDEARKQHVAADVVELFLTGKNSGQETISDDQSRRMLNNLYQRSYDQIMPPVLEKRTLLERIIGTVALILSVVVIALYIYYHYEMAKQHNDMRRVVAKITQESYKYDDKGNRIYETTDEEHKNAMFRKRMAQQDAFEEAAGGAFYDVEHGAASQSYEEQQRIWALQRGKKFRGESGRVMQLGEVVNPVMHITIHEEDHDHVIFITDGSRMDLSAFCVNDTLQCYCCEVLQQVYHIPIEKITYGLVAYFAAWIDTYSNLPAYVEIEDKQYVKIIPQGLTKYSQIQPIVVSTVHEIVVKDEIIGCTAIVGNTEVLLNHVFDTFRSMDAKLAEEFIKGWKQVPYICDKDNVPVYIANEGGYFWTRPATNGSMGIDPITSNEQSKQIALVRPDKKGVYFVSLGNMLKIVESGDIVLHDCSSMVTWSGCPVVFGRKILGVHAGMFGNSNYFIRADYIDKCICAMTKNVKLAASVS